MKELKAKGYFTLEDRTRSDKQLGIGKKRKSSNNAKGTKKSASDEKVQKKSSSKSKDKSQSKSAVKEAEKEKIEDSEGDLNVLA